MNNKFSLGLYLFALCGGLASGMAFSRSQYYRGKSDAYKEVAKELEIVREEVLNECLAKHNKEESH